MMLVQKSFATEKLKIKYNTYDEFKLYQDTLSFCKLKKVEMSWTVCIAEQSLNYRFTT